MKYERRQVTADEQWLHSSQRVEREQPSNELVAVGQCRQCNHDTKYPVILEEVAVSASGGEPVALGVTRMFRCRCSEPHDERPDEAYTGCGAYWFATVVPDEGGYKLALAEPEFVSAAIAVDLAAENQGQIVQAAAEKWLGVVTALLALFSIGGTALASKDVRGLEIPFNYFVAGFAVLAVVAAVLAIICGHRAAYGWLTMVPTDSNAAGVSIERRRSDIKSRINSFRIAVPSAGIALILALCAVLTIWFAPRSEIAGQLVRVTYQENGKETNVCGSLLTGNNGDSVSLQVSEDTKAITFTLSGPIARIIPVLSCPS